MIQLKNVSKFYYSKGIIASGISKVNLELNIGEFVVVTGESGGGKTTLLNVISGLDSYEEGEMYIDGQETSHYLASDFEEYRKKYIGNIFQSFNLVNSYTVYQNIELILLINGYKKEFIKTRVPGIIKRVGLEAYTRTKVSKLSGGQKQRVSIARALAKDTDIIVADEPTGNLDSASADGIVQLLSEISQDKLVVVVTHNYEQFAPYATRKIKMHDGKVVEDNQIKKAPAIQNGVAPRMPSGTTSGIQNGMPSAADMANIIVQAGINGAQPANAAPVGNAATTVNTASMGDAAPAANTASMGDAAPAAEPVTVTDTSPNAAAAAKPIKKETISNNMRAGSKIRLGIRNTFNIFPKFILLLVVFLFVVVAVTSEYTSFQHQDEEANKLGYNDYFYNYSEDRVVLKKSDGSQFTEDDLRTIKTTTNVKSVSANDIMLDNELYIEDGDFSYGAYPKSIDEFDGELIAGRMPESDKEVIITGYKGDYYFKKSRVQNIINKKYTIIVGEDKEIKLTVVGAAYKDDGDEAMAYSGDMFLSDAMMSDILVEIYNYNSEITTTINGKAQKSTEGDSYFSIVPNKKVNKGDVLASEDVNNFYDNGVAKGKTIKVTAKNIYYKKSINLEITDTYGEKTFESKTGYKDYESHNGSLYISYADYDKLFKRGNYQCTAYVEDVRDVKATTDALESKGYVTLPLKDALITYGNEVISIVQAPIAIIIVLALFFIAYFVIRLILRSRTGSFSILRMLGLAKNNIRRILDVELLMIVNIAYILFLAVVAIVNYDVISFGYVKTLVEYMKTTDYVILYIILVAMAYLISGKFARKLFKKTAMGTYREEE